MNVKGYSWLGVGTDSFDETLRFFSEVMGLSKVVVDERGVAILKVSEGQVLEVFGPGTEGRKLTSPPVIAFEVDDVSAARDELLRHGVDVLGEIGSWNGFEWLKFRGPEGRKLTSLPVIAFEVDNVAAARDELLQHGVEVLGEIGSWNGFEWLKFRGPEGHVFALQKTAPAGWEETK